MAPRKNDNERKLTSFRPFGNIASHIDPMVGYTFLALLLISIVILAFKAGNREDCTDARMVLIGKEHTNSKTYTVGEVITLIAADSLSRRTAWRWDFGDSTNALTGARVHHTFNKAGSFVIKLSSGKCSWNREVIVIMPVRETGPAPAAVDVFPVIDGPEQVFSGRRVTFSNNSPNATSWTWRLIQDDAETYTGSSVTYTFGAEGERILSLIVNGDTAHRVTKRIQVLKAPPRDPDVGRETVYQQPDVAVPATAPEPEKPRVPAVSDDEFKFMLEQVVNKQKNASDFSVYLCDNLNARVLVNDNKTDNFSHFCSYIHGNKVIQIERVNLIKNEHGCVKEIRVVYNKKKWLGIFKRGDR